MLIFSQGGRFLFYKTQRGAKTTVAMADEILQQLRKIDQSIELKYNKFYIGLSKDGKPYNFVIFRPKRTALRLEPKIKRTDEIEEKLESAGLDILEYSTRDGRYRMRLSKSDITKHAELLQQLFTQAYSEFSGSELVV